MNVSFRTALRRLVICVVLSMGLLHVADADAGYPLQTNSYQAPWVDGYTDYTNSGDPTVYYACVSGSLGGVEGCSFGYWSSHAAPRVVVSQNWTAASNPSNCGPYGYMYVGTNCYSGGFPATLDGNPDGGLGTVVGQRCIYPVAPGYSGPYDGGTLTGSAYQPGYCMVIFRPRICPCKNGSQASQNTPQHIDTSVGNEHETFTDYKGQGAFPLTFTRGYNSLLGNALYSTGAENLGQGWTSNIGAHLYINTWGQPTVPCQEAQAPYRYFECPSASSSLGLEVTVWHPGGGEALFSYSSTSGADGTPLAPEPNSSGQLFFVTTLPSPATGSGYRYLRDDGYSEYYDSTGRLMAVEDRNGLFQIYSYYSSNPNQLQSITDPAGRSLQFTYYTSGTAIGLLQTMTDPAGYVYTYSYDTHNNLSTVSHPDKLISGTVTYATVTYKYENGSFPNALTGVVDENTNRYMTWSYDSSGRATSSYLGSSTAQINKFSVAYTTDSGGRITSAAITEPSPHSGSANTRTLNFTTSTNVDQMTSSSGRCTECGDPAASRTYDANGYVSSETDFSTTDAAGNPVTNTTNYVHDATGLETSRTEAYGTSLARTITTTWDASRQPALITEPGRTTAYTYDGVGHVLTKTVTDTATSVARTTTCTYNSFGLLETVTDPLGHVTSFGYASNGDLISITKDPSGLDQVTQITSYDANGKPTTIVDSNGVITTLGYDGLERLTSRTVDGATTTYSYDSAGELKEVTLPGGSSLSYDYDSAHRLIDVYDNFNDKIVYTLDNMGNRIGEDTKDASNTIRKTLQRTYSYLNQLTQLSTNGSVYNPSTHLDVAQTLNTAYTPDAAGNVTTITDPASHLTTQGYDALNRLAAVVDPQTPVSGNTNYNYDPLDRVQDVTDPIGLDTHYVYDAFGDVTEQESPDTGTSAYTYDLDGNRLTKTDARGVTTTYVYDALNRLTSISYPDASRDVAYAYDTGTYGTGHLYSISDATGTTVYQYDSHGNTTQKTVTAHGHAFVVGYQYDSADDLTGMTYPSGMQVSYVRDTVERITEVDANGSPVVSGITYRPFGPITLLTYGNGLAETRSYDQSYKLLSITATGVQDLSFHYDQDSDIVGITDGLNSGNNQTLSYDTINRLTSASGAYGSQSYQYDLDGNRSQETLGSATTLFGYSYQNLLSPGGNQLLSVGAQSYSYDAMGNTINDGVHSYDYDSTGRLTGYDGVTTAYLYNGLGQRTVKFPVDDVTPTVTITSPTGGVSGTVSVTATAVDTFGISSVDFTVDGQPLGTATTAPYAVSWNTSTYSIGSHVLVAVAHASDGSSVTSAADTVSVLDVTPPTVSLTAPVSGADISGSVSVSATASDNVAVTSVQFQLDGSDLGAPITAAPYSYTWDSSTASDGSHTLTAIAYDAAGNSTTATMVSVTVDNSTPAVSITAPAASASLSGSVAVSASASDDLGITSVRFQLDGANLGSPVTVAPYTLNWDTTAVSDGVHSLTVIAYDSTGRSATSAPVSVTVDNLPPTVSVSAPATGASVSGTVSVTAAASDDLGVASVQFQLDGANLGSPVTAAPYAISWDTTAAAFGSHTLTAIASDATGNHTTSTAITVTVDNVPPTAAISAPVAGAHLAGTASLTASASDNAGVTRVQFQLDGVNIGGALTTAPYTLAWDSTTATDGNHTLTAIASDAAGNSTTSAGVSVTVDNSPPTVSLTAPTSGAHVAGTISLAATAADDIGVASVQFQVDGVDQGSLVTTAPYTLNWLTTAVADGLHSLTAIARDATGNHTTSVAVSVTVDNTAPTVAVTSPAASAHARGTVGLTVAASDNNAVASIQYKLDGTNLGSPVTATPFSASWDSTTAADGSHTLTAVATDTAGNATTSAGVTVVVDNTAPTVSVISPAAGGVSGTVTVSASASDNAAVASVQFQLDGVNLGSAITTAPYNYSWVTTTATAGAHNLTAIAYDTAGNSNTSAAVAVTVPDTTAPTVSITSPVNNASVSGTISITASASDNVGVTKVQFKLDGANLGSAVTTAPYTVSWNTASASNVSHTLTAVASDAAGHNTTSSTITVTVPLQVPPVPTLSPSFYETTPTADGPGSVTLTWTSSTPVTSYVLQKASDTSFTTPTQVYSGTATSKSVAPSVPTYYRVHACNSAGCSDWSATSTIYPNNYVCNPSGVCHIADVRTVPGLPAPVYAMAESGSDSEVPTSDDTDRKIVLSSMRK